MNLTYEKLLMEVYEAASNPDYFHELGDLVCAFMDGGRAHFMLIDPLSGREYVSCLSGERDDFARVYNEIYLPRDFRVPRVLALPKARFTDERSYVTEEEARQSDIHQDLMVRYGVHNISGANLQTGSAMGWFGLSVNSEGAEFDDMTMRRLADLSHHLQRAYHSLKANADLAIDRKLMAAALDEVRSGILIAERGRLAHANAMMQDLLSRGFFRLRGERLECRDRDETKKLADLQSPGPYVSREAVIVRDRRAGESFAATCRILFPQFDTEGHISGQQRIVTVTPIVEQEVLDPAAVEAFCREHRLSVRESEVVGVVLSDVTLGQHARERGVTVDTVRKQLKSAMAKLEVTSQKDIVRLYERFRLAS